MILFYKVLRYLYWRDKKISFKPKGDKCHHKIKSWTLTTLFTTLPNKSKNCQKSSLFLKLHSRLSLKGKERKALNFFLLFLAQSSNPTNKTPNHSIKSLC